jgi:hypothetical protein
LQGGNHACAQQRGFAAAGCPYYGHEARTFEFCQQSVNLLLAAEEDVRLGAAKRA